MKEARARRDLIAGEIANGRNPRLLLGQLRAAPPIIKPLAAWAVDYRESRIDLADQTREAMKSHLRSMQTLAERDPARITPGDVRGLPASS